MRIFIAGATGVLGRRVVKLLVDKNHEIVALSRSPQNAEWLKANKATPYSGDIFDEESLRKGAAGCDAVLHLATAIPNKKRTTVDDWTLNDRIRREGTQNLVKAAVENKCRLYMQQSITFIYGDRNGEWVDESTPIPDRQGSILQSAVDMERIVQDATLKDGLPSIILRFGAFYSHDSAQTQAMFEMAQESRTPVIGSGKAFWNIINVDDAALAVVCAVENHAGNIGEIFNVCDDEPATFGDIVHFVAETLRSKRPFRFPEFMAKLALGSHMVDTLVSSVRCKNAKIKERLGWKPAYPTYREGYKAEIEKWLELQ